MTINLRKEKVCLGLTVSEIPVHNQCDLLLLGPWCRLGQHMMAGVCSRVRVLSLWTGRERKRNRKGLGSHYPFKGTLPVT